MTGISRRSALAGALLPMGLLGLAGGPVLAQSTPQGPSASRDASKQAQEIIPAYRPRFGRSRPVIVIVGQNEGTETTDFVVPFGILSRSGVAQVVTASVREGPVKMGSLSFALETTLRGFDERFPQGADYAVIPNVVNVDDPALLDWIKAQAAKGATIVGVCIGATVVANTGLMDGRRATSHFGTEASRSQRFPKVKWERNIRYVADGNVISSAGISASMPISIALVEAIAGRAKATSTARDVGMSDWSSFHNSDVFRAAQPARGKPVEGPRAKKATVGVPVKSGDDEIALGLTADAYFLTSKVEPLAMAVSSGKVRLANGLELIPNGILGKDPVDRMLQPLSAVDATRTLDLVLADISKTYGVGAAQLAALIMEYPGFRPGPAGS